MEYTFKKHPVSDVENFWLEEVAKAKNFDPKVLKVQLRDKLPRDFDPNSMD